jgi:hypothetical protein
MEIRQFEGHPVALIRRAMAQERLPKQLLRLRDLALITQMPGQNKIRLRLIPPMRLQLLPDALGGAHVAQFHVGVEQHFRD